MSQQESTFCYQPSSYPDKMLLSRVIIVSTAILCSGCSAFAPRQMQQRRSRMMAPAKAQVMEDIDIMCLVNTANLCSSEEDTCALEHQEALVNTLESQLTCVEMRLEELRELSFALSDRPRVEASHRHQTTDPVFDEMDTMCLINASDYCINEGCDVDQNEALVNRLSEQYSGWNLRHGDLTAALKRLKAHSLGPRLRMYDRKTESLVESIQERLEMEYGDENNRVPISRFAYE